MRAPGKAISIGNIQRDNRFDILIPVTVQDASKDENLTFYFAPKNGWLCVKLEVSDSSQKFKIVNETLRAKQFGDIWLPMLCRRGSVDHMEDALPDHEGTWLSVEKYQLDNISDDLFTFKPRPGNLLKRESEIYRISPSGSEEVVRQIASRNRGYSPFGWLYMASVTSLLVLTIGAFVKWKRKQLAKRD